MNEPAAYEDRTTLAVYSVLIELGQVLGSYADRFVVVGGSVPWLLFPDAQPRHIGTMDVDLSLDAEALGKGQYADLVHLLEASGYQRNQDGMRVFQMVRTVAVDEGEPIAVIVDFLMPKSARFTRNKPPILDDFAVQRTSGAEFAMRYFVHQEFHGRMPDGRQNSVKLRIASIPALLVMKGFALANRDKPKDAYDIYYSVSQFEGGPKALAEACRPLLESPVAAEGYGHIAGKFKSLEDFGPETVKRFLLSAGTASDMSADQILLDAFAQVRAWLRAMGLG